jgi:hypothetical protein
MADTGLFIFIIFLIAANGACFWWLWQKAGTDNTRAVMLFNAVIVCSLLLGLYLQNGNVAIFHR